MISTDPTARFDLTHKKIWVAGHNGMVGTALLKRLSKENCQIVTVNKAVLDLRRQADVEGWVAAQKPDCVFLAAAKVGGILANDSYPASFLYDNIIIESNIIEACRRTGVAKLLVLGSSCIYPKFAAQPIAESALLTGPLEPTNQWYAIAKIAGLKLSQAYRRQYGCDYISAMPTNLYGPADNFDLQSSHVLPALIRKFHEAKVRRSEEVTIWGSGTARREFLHVDDCADALVHLMHGYSGEDPVNVGTGEDVSILQLAKLVAEIVGFKGEIAHDLTKPDGTPRKLLDVSRLRDLGWRASIGLADGIAGTYEWFCRHFT
jgi:GDP-L-fucose synthase